MKYKKYSYIIVIMLMLLLGVNNVNAAQSKECYYMSADNNFKAKATLKWGHASKPFVGIPDGMSDYADVVIDKDGNGSYDSNDEHINNWYASNWYINSTKGGLTFSDYYDSKGGANNANNPSCPQYLVVEHCWDWEIWATDSESFAKQAVASTKSAGCEGSYASNSYKDSSNNSVPITKDDYYAEFKFEGIIDFDKNGNPTCADFNAIFGDKNDPDSIRYLIDEILGYVRVIVPMLVILLGTIDFSKAVMAGKEDNMKKAQTDFVKRVVIGVAIFFVPLLVDLVMELADIVWAGNYSICKL